RWAVRPKRIRCRTCGSGFGDFHAAGEQGGIRMASRFSELIIDAHDLQRLAQFWCDVLGYRVLEETDEVVEIGAVPITAEDVRRAPIAPPLVFVRVPEDKTVKNRVHIDVSP